jgi:2-polyprenyl-3-methyl-5-hydroxy-6-metoxy-1,4-benzoquinol methylase
VKHLVMEFINCPVCHSSKFRDLLSVKDHTVSRETFQIVECVKCSLKLTNPRPANEDIGKYYESDAYISHSDTSEGIINKLYKTVRRISLKRKLKLINGFNSETKSILDIGCGTGAFLETMKRHNWLTKGVEPNDFARNKAISEYNLDVSTEVFLESGKETFDVITLWHVLEHVHPLEKRIAEIKQHMKKNATLVIAVPNCECTDAKKYQEFWAAYDVPRHLYHFTPATMTLLMEQNGLEVIEKKSMPFDAFYVSLLSEKYKKSSQNIISALFHGFVSSAASWNNVEKCSSIIYIIKSKN